MSGVRARLACLWLSQSARVLADWCLLVLTLRVVTFRPEGGLLPWAVPALFLAPFVLLTPLNGYVANAWHRRSAVVALGLVCLFAVGWWLAREGTWLYSLGVTAVGAAAFSAARQADLPAWAGTQLPRLIAWMDLGTVAGMFGGLALGLALTPVAAPELVLPGLNVLWVLAACAARFPASVSLPEPWSAFARFFRDSRRIVQERTARGPLLGLTCFLTLLLAAAVVLLLDIQARRASEGHGGLPRWRVGLVWIGASVVLGCATVSLQGNPRRSPGLVPLGAVLLVIALGWAALAIGSGNLPLVPGMLLGFGGALIVVPLRAAYLAALPPEARGNGTALLNAVIYLPSLVLLGLLLGDVHLAWPLSASNRLGLLCLVAVIGAILSWRSLLAPTFEMFTEWGLLPMYRIEAHGPGKDRIPLHGPLIIVANHASYFDPFWICKLVPRHARPMMTAVFYDLPVVRWLMAHVVHAIRVPVAAFRREAPELREAADALRQGDCLLIFPEGQLRRKEEPILRLFGQGVWRILHELPDTPVMVAWIEGGWGSYASYAKGPPMKNKRVDRRRRIDIAMAEPRPLPAEVLADQRATRAYLMRACLECRRLLGLEVPAGIVPAAADLEGGTGHEPPGAAAHEINS